MSLLLFFRPQVLIVAEGREEGEDGKECPDDRKPHAAAEAAHNLIVQCQSVEYVHDGNEGEQSIGIASVGDL